MTMTGSTPSRPHGCSTASASWTAECWSCSTATASLPMLIKPDARPDPDGPPGYDGSAFTRSILAGHDNPAIRPAASPPTKCITTATLMACWSGRVSIWTPAA